MERLGLAAARRIALAAQGFGAPAPRGPVTMRHVRGVLGKVAQFQLDSVNVCVRAHYMPLFSRLGPYDRGLLHRLGEQAPRRTFEYWGHAAAMIDVRLQPALRYRMAQARGEAWSGIVRIQDEHPDLVERVYAEVVERGPLTARQIQHDEVRRHDNWGWNWSAVKTVLEWLLWQGRVTPAFRNAQFERAYDLPERVLPAAVWDAPTPDPAAAHRDLIRRSAAAQGVATERCLGDYFYLRRAPVRQAVRELVDAGELLPVRVEGWGEAYVWPQARRPRAMHAEALISPFDSLIFQRERLQGLFGSHYRIEIYVPAAKRRFGYYVYPFLLGDTLAARVDLKAARATGRLLVQAAWREPDRDLPDALVAPALARQLVALAGWLGLGDVTVMPRGDLAPALTRALLRA